MHIDIHDSQHIPTPPTKPLTDWVAVTVSVSPLTFSWTISFQAGVIIVYLHQLAIYEIINWENLNCVNKCNISISTPQFKPRDPPQSSLGLDYGDWGANQSSAFFALVLHG